MTACPATPFVSNVDWEAAVSRIRDQTGKEEDAAVKAEASASQATNKTQALHFLSLAATHTPASASRQRARALALLATGDVEGARDGLLLALELGNDDATLDLSQLPTSPAPPTAAAEAIERLVAGRRERALRAETSWSSFAQPVETHQPVDAESVLRRLNNRPTRPFVLQDVDVHGLARWGVREFQGTFGTFTTRLMASRSGIFSYYNPGTVRVRVLENRGEANKCVFPDGQPIKWLTADPWLRYVPLAPMDNASQCCAPHHAVPIEKRDGWSALRGEPTSGHTLEADEATYLRIHFPKVHPDRATIQWLLSPRTIADKLPNAK